MRSNLYGVIGEIDNLPGCSQVAVFHSVFCPPLLRGQKLGDKAHQQRITQAKFYGYDCAICTVDLSNEPQLTILRNNGWTQVHEFESSKTQHNVGIFVRKL